MRCFREGQQVYRGRHLRWLGRAHGPRHRSLPHRSRRHRDSSSLPARPDPGPRTHEEALHHEPTIRLISAGGLHQTTGHNY